MDISVLEVERREAVGSSNSRRLRRAGRVPAVLYGHGEEVVSLALDEEAARTAVEGSGQIVTLRLDGEEQRALIKDSQYDVFALALLHVDFARVALDERVSVSVALELHGTPKEVAGGAMLEQPLNSLDVECRADSIPQNILVEVGHLEIGAMIHVGDVELPAGVTAVTDEKAVIAVLHPPRAEEEPEEEAPAESESAEPELIGREDKEGEEDAEKAPE